MSVSFARRHRIAALSSVLLSAHLLATPAFAGTITDPANDFLPTFTGTHDPSLDVLSFSATFDGTVFHLSGVENGPIAAFPTGLLVFGFNRGVGASNFASIGHGGVTFDSVVTLSHAGVIGGNALNLASITASIIGASFTLNVPLTSVPALAGALPSQYGINLWPRDTSQTGNAQIADFAPDNSDLIVGVPEPLSASLLAAGLFGLILLRGRRYGTA
jgi:hypothetical protein